ncbi:ComF family protein [Bifidobacterium actinocoloniiforme]|uniref:ComF family protein n=1 Tax=Bifidobacterium actinocoloniiforme TaxID=638619 RepID=UPI0006892B69|nr:phosphoribosyltransferase family protein [Bifidobacterium actinocoloniiforme]
MAAVRDLIVPRGCAGCDCPDEVLCPACAALFRQYRSFPAAGFVWGSGLACAGYQGRARRAILEWKDHDDEEVTRPLGRAMGELAVQSLERAWTGNLGPVPSQVLIVPAPSSSKSVRRRGRVHMPPVAGAAAASLRQAGLPAQVQLALIMGSVRGKSVELHGSSARASRLSGRIHTRAGIELTGQSVILVDDIVTSGSTIRQCAAALRTAGAYPLTALALARAGRGSDPSRAVEPVPVI